MSKVRGLVLDALLGIGVLAALGYAVVTRLPVRDRMPKGTWAQVQGGTPLSGDDGGPVLVEFVDYQCPFCARAEVEVFDALRDSVPGLRRVVRHFPLQSHAHAVDAAVAVECAGSQTGSIERMHRLLYESQDSIGVLPWVVLARRAGVVDSLAFESCRRGDAVRQRVESDRRLGEELMVTGTPTFFLDRERVPGGPPAQLRAFILARAGN